MKSLNRAQRRYIKGLNKEQLINWLSVYGTEMYNDGIRDSFLSILLKLHDEFNFGNKEIWKLIQLCEPWMAACRTHEDDIDSEGIKQQLLSEGITCLNDTGL